MLTGTTFSVRHSFSVEDVVSVDAVRVHREYGMLGDSGGHLVCLVDGPPLRGLKRPLLRLESVVGHVADRNIQQACKESLHSKPRMVSKRIRR